MRQKYFISVDDGGERLLIKEYADIDKNHKWETAEMAGKRKFTLLCRETYKSAMIRNAIAGGINDLVSAIRTRNMFPTRPFALKIAESVIEMYESKNSDPIELFFDDIDSVSAESA